MWPAGPWPYRSSVRLSASPPNAHSAGRTGVCPPCTALQTTCHGNLAIGVGDDQLVLAECLRVGHRDRNLILARRKIRQHSGIVQHDRFETQGLEALFDFDFHLLFQLIISGNQGAEARSVHLYSAYRHAVAGHRAVDLHNHVGRFQIHCDAGRFRRVVGQQSAVGELDIPARPKGLEYLGSAEIRHENQPPVPITANTIEMGLPDRSSRRIVPQILVAAMMADFQPIFDGPAFFGCRQRIPGVLQRPAGPQVDLG